ncbi:hypothetical protein [Haloechinothrix sp. LS1_15]|uniref:hypothetical protein n=1 Tax=Haloechinothrix sp. LS1_15 TaxID=2652248 RepID=UPI002947B6D6|nr:hypothetical protein [Haloechinothrix sp. LS1_15]MDV6014402.1 hypothetical protein [Haloechinothrix sp. LS1_15]
MDEILPNIADVEYTPGDSEEADRIAENGWRVDGSGALILVALSSPCVPGSISPYEVGEYEYSANDVYLSLDDLPRNDIDKYLKRAAVRGVGLAKWMLRDAASLPGSETLRSLVHVFVDVSDEDFFMQGSRVRFYTSRGSSELLGDRDWESASQIAVAVLKIEDIVYSNS